MEPAKKKLIKETKKQLKWAFGQSTKYLLWNFLIAYPVRMRSYIHLSVLHDELDIDMLNILKMNSLMRLRKRLD
ncbi:MAG: Putative cytoplasmic protein [Candidatus Midichloria mitochondrii]|uniref:Putative cytoplasmic protein n=1 Tax=Midichloria mitochondrii (strain IricVA) TaxID=696127 RepID=F7XV78_MIDMI|nr:putative cytoplasmic protein [Candidatus Midichloria mitochondrii IricVA]